MPRSSQNPASTWFTANARAELNIVLRNLALAAGLLLSPMLLPATGHAARSTPAQEADIRAEAVMVERLNQWGLHLTERSGVFFAAHPVIPDRTEWGHSRRTLRFFSEGDAVAEAHAQAIGIWKQGRWTWPGRLSPFNSQAAQQLRAWIEHNGVADDLRHELGFGDMQRLLALAVEVAGQDGVYLIPQADSWLVLVFSRPHLLPTSSASSRPANRLKPQTRQDSTPHVAAGIDDPGREPNQDIRACMPAGATASTLTAEPPKRMARCYAKVARGRLADHALVLPGEAEDLAALLKEANSHLVELNKDITQAKAALEKIRQVPISDDNFMAVMNVSRLPETVDSMASHQERLFAMRETLAQQEHKQQALREAAAILKQANPDGGRPFELAVDQALAALLNPQQQRVEEFLYQQAEPLQEATRLTKEFNALQRAYYDKLHGPIPLSIPLEISN